MSSTASKRAAKEKKELTPAQKRLKIAGNWIVNILCVIIIVFSLIVAIFTIVRTTNGDGVTNFFGKVYMSVQSGSMSPTFDKDDVIICDEYNGDGSDLKVGQVITFKAVVNGYESFNTHRIVRILSGEGTRNAVFQTQGDFYNAEYNTSLETSDRPDNASVTATNIVATWGGVDENGHGTSGKVMKNIGAFGNWLQDNENGRTRFFCVIVLPLILLFVVYAFILVRTLVIAKLDKVKAEKAADATLTADSLSEEDKRRLAEEYLASLGKDPSALSNDSGDDASTAVDDVAPADDTSAPDSSDDTQADVADADEKKAD